MTSFLEFSKTLEKISQTTKRLEIIDILCDYFSDILSNYNTINNTTENKNNVDNESEIKEMLTSTLYLLTCTIYPSYYNKELGIGETIIIKLIADYSCSKEKVIKEKYKKIGDLGDLISNTTSKARIGQLNINTANKTNKKEKNCLSVVSVLKVLREVSYTTGKNSVDTKKKLLLNLMMKIDEEKNIQLKYLIRIFECKLKIGLALKTVLIALGKSFYYYYNRNNDENNKEEINVNEIIKTAYNRLPNFDLLVDNLLKYKIEDLLEHTSITVGIPLKPMLAQPSKDLNMALSKVEKGEYNDNSDDENEYIEEKKKIETSNDDFPEKEKIENKEKVDINNLQQSDLPSYRAEFKYDGERLQIHRNHDNVYIYSRNSENLIERYNELIKVVKMMECKEFIIDTEVVAYNKEKKSIEQFQTLVTRKRKLDEKETKKCQLDSFFKKEEKGNEIISVENKIQDNKNNSSNICVFVFDILFCNGKSTIELPYEERRKILNKNITPIKNEIEFAIGYDLDINLNVIKNNNFTNDGIELNTIDDLFLFAIQSNCEGLILKKYGPSSPYLPSKRTFNWIKVKEDYLQSVGDSLDLIVMGAYYGKGKRKNFYGTFLLGAYNERNNRIEALTKIGTGFSDADLERYFKELKRVDVMPKEYCGNDIIPDVWIDPINIWEVKSASLSTSNTYLCAKDLFYNSYGMSKGISLRFPRYIKDRKDKNIEDSTTTDTIFMLYQQKNNEESIEEEF
ncbi:DNA ligase [Spraguea lophii 42_110]|uniref:DNA ligase 1 n=1 Tax=Spraguea lophii (strain 42_110) TaxID=1358809 RepID=S7WE81_SPRLO|nr:DNA ligase [Spraguea lophii 42_110]